MSNSFEQRVQRKLEEGWEIADEYDDRVVLVRQRGFWAPSRTMSILTLGLANVYYALRDVTKSTETFVIYDER